MTALLVVEDIEVVYQRAIVALQGISFSVEPGQIVALIGSNGAGKTTCLRAISGFIGLDRAKVTRGRISYKGDVLNGLRPPRSGAARSGPRSRARKDLPQPDGGGKSRGRRVPWQDRRKAKSMVYGFFPRLHELRRHQAGFLSGGERQMLAIGAAIMCAPETLMIDELSMGLAPVVIDDLIQRLLQIRRDLGITLLLVEQSAAAVLSFADYAFVLENGRVALHGEAKKLAKDENVRKLYLGLSEGGRTNYRYARIRRQSIAANG